MWTYVGVDFAMAHCEGTIFVQQDSTVTLIQFLFSWFTSRDGGVGLLITPYIINRKLKIVNI